MKNKKFVEDLNNINVTLSGEQFAQFDKYYEILVEWNSFMNLTGVTEYEEVLQKHYVDSLVLPLDSIKRDILNINDSQISLIDVGTGAGFPGMPLKIAHPDLKVTLLDSLNKRIKFLDEVVNQLGLKEIETIHSRAEDGARNKQLREKFDISVSRAVANLSTLLEYNMPFVRVGGVFVAYKSGEIDEELANASNAIKLLGGELLKVDKFTLPDSDIDRSLVYIKKIKNTPGKYPRKAGLPTKEPII